MSLDIITQPRVHQDRFSLFTNSRILRSDAALDDADIQLEVKAQRMRRKRPELTYEFTRDPGYLHQYHLVRMQCFSSDVYGKDLFASPKPDEVDNNALTMIVRDGHHVVGGAAVIVSTPRIRRVLPVERPDFKLNDVLPEFRLDNAGYCQITRLALLDEYRATEVVYNLVKRMTDKIMALGLSYLFIQSSSSKMRLYNSMVENKDDIEFILLNHVNLPDAACYKGVKEMLGVYAYKNRKNNILGGVNHEERILEGV
jgi:hypothetical protein